MSSGTNQERIEQNNLKLNELKNRANNLPDYQNMDEYPKREEMNNAIYTALLEYLSKTNTTEYTPQNDYNPATKKYVDDNASNPQVFYWDGKTNQTGLDFWNEIYQLQKTQPCLVYTEYTQQGAKITQSWHYNNNLPTSIFDVNVSSRWLSDKSETNSCKNSTTVYSAKLYFDIENDAVTNIHYNTGYREYMYLDTDENYSTPYTPQYPGSPATKKYVDDHAGGEQVFYWDGKTDQTGLDFWTNLYNINKTQNIYVIWKQPNTTAKGIYAAYIYVNELVTNNNIIGNLLTPSQNSLNNSWHRWYLTQYLVFTYQNDVVTDINANTGAPIHILDTNSNYPTPYTPQYPGSPATKKYVDDAIADKYDKTGGEISGDVKVDGDFTLDIEDEDYDAGVKFNRVLDSNLGVILTLLGYADNTNYKPIIRNIGTPQSDYDAANKKYVDDHILTPDVYLVALDSDGNIDIYSSTLTYSKVKSELTNHTIDVYLDVIYGTSRFYVKAVQDMDTNNGPIKFRGIYLGSDNTFRLIEFTLDSTNTLTVNHIFLENWNFKVQDIVANYNNTLTYPSTKAVFDQFQRKPVVVWETDSNFLKAIQADISENPAWQLTGLDMTPFKRIKIYSKAGKGKTTAGATGGIILEMSLDLIAGFADYGGNFVGSVIVQKPNDENRYASLTCAVSADKTKFVVLRQTSLYGTAATTNNDIGADVYKIEGYYD